MDSGRIDGIFPFDGGKAGGKVFTFSMHSRENEESRAQYHSATGLIEFYGTFVCGGVKWHKNVEPLEDLDGGGGMGEEEEMRGNKEGEGKSGRKEGERRRGGEEGGGEKKKKEAKEG